MQLQNKTALITGAGRGIGLAFARRYVEEGARVAIADVDVDRAQAAAETIGSQAIAVEMDVADQNSINKGFRKSEDTLKMQKPLSRGFCVLMLWKSYHTYKII